MSDSTVETKPKVEIKARVWRIAWDRKPKHCSERVWRWLGKKRIPFTGRWENLGVIASSEMGTASAEFKPRS